MHIEDWLVLAGKKYPALSRGWAALTPVKAAQPVLGVTKNWHLLWHPHRLAELHSSGWEPADALLHVLLHLLRDHEERRGNREHSAWNAACDREINDEIDSDCRGDCLLPEDIDKEDHETAEHYYSESDTCESSCGSGAGGEPLPDEPTEGGIPKQVAGSLRKQIAEDIVAKKGDLPNSLKLWAEEQLKPASPKKLPWRLALGKAIKGRENYSYSRLPRAQSGKVVLPGTVQERPAVFCVIDTSGSMVQKAQEVYAVLLWLRQHTNCKLIYCDTREKGKPEKLTCPKKAIAKAIGGGGTDLYSACNRKGKVVCITDGFHGGLPKGTIEVLV